MVASVISNTAGLPWSAVVQVFATFPSGLEVSGSGVIVDRNTVLTAAHVVYDEYEGGEATEVVVLPGYAGTYLTFNPYTAAEITSFGAELNDNPDFLTRAEIARDSAVLSFSVELGSYSGGWMNVASLGAGGNVVLSGYPGTTPAYVRDGDHLWTDFGPVTNNGDGTLSTRGIFVAPGHSGGPAWFDADPGLGVSPFVVGTISAGDGIPSASSRSLLTSLGADNPQSASVLARIDSDNALLSGRLFDAVYYLASNRDVRNAAVDSRAHYMTLGWREGRNPNALFDTAGYLATYADVRASGLNPLEHYRLFGWQEGRDPSTAFDTGSYLAAYRDVAASGLNPLDHYLRFGQAEGRLTFGDGTWT